MVDDRIEVEQLIETSSDKPNSAHMVKVPEDQPDQTPQAYRIRAMVEGFAITAICGYTFVPHKQAGGLPVCQECLDIYNSEGYAGHPDNGSQGLPDE